jgi:hypothetical protein
MQTVYLLKYLSLRPTRCMLSARLTGEKQMTMNVPQSGMGDKTHAIVKGVISSVPGIGGVAAELFALVISPPLEKRRDTWMNQVVDALNKLNARKGITLEDLTTNEQFQTTLIQATHAAMRHHQHEKLEALKNAILNSALPSAPEDSLQQMYLNLVESLTVWHLRLLILFQNPPVWFERTNKSFPQISMGGLSTVLTTAYPELQNRREFYDQLFKDLHGRGLVNTGGLHTTMSGTGLREKRTTSMGDEFLIFISNPVAS